MLANFINKKTIVILILVIIGLQVTSFTVCRIKSHIYPQKPLVKGVKTLRLSKKDVNDFYEVSGTVKAKNISIIASRIMGTVTDIPVKQGDKVSLGQEVLTIDNKDITQRLEAAKSAYEGSLRNMDSAKETNSLSDSIYNRYKKLITQNAISQQEMDQAETKKKIAALDYERAQSAVNQAMANLEEAKVNLSFSHIYSPSDGVVTNKNIDVGTMATAGTPLLTIEDISEFKTEANINEHLADQIKLSMPVEVVIDSISQSPYKAVVSEIVPSMDPSSRTFLMKAVIESDPNKTKMLKTGLFARILIPVTRKQILTIPANALVEKGQLLGVYVVDDKGNVSYRMIRTGKNIGGEVEVLSGLKEGESIIAEGIENAIDGGIISDKGQ
jgi:RND family efflux transporter MFP subunit